MINDPVRPRDKRTFQFRTCLAGNQREFAVEYDGAKSTLRPTGRTGSLDRICEFDSKEGDTYFLKAGIIRKLCDLTLQQRRSGAAAIDGRIDSNGDPAARQSDDATDCHQLAQRLDDHAQYARTR